jgi:hypothetical protein
MGDRFAGRVQALWLRLYDKARQCRPVLLQLGNDLERSVTEDECRLVPGLAVSLDDVYYPSTIDWYESANPADHREERISRRRQQFHGIAGHVFGDNAAMAVQNRAARRRERYRPEPVCFRFQLELAVLNDLGSEECAAEIRTMRAMSARSRSR